MGCCSPDYRKTVNDKEEMINGKGADRVPLLVKIIAIIVIGSGAAAAIFM